MLTSIFSQSDYFTQNIDINSHTEWQTVQIQICMYTVCKGRVYPGSAGQGLNVIWIIDLFNPF